MTDLGDWRGRTVLVTGHTGFKGAWLSMWLTELGAEVHGLALDPLEGSLYEQADIGSRITSDTRGDIVDPDVVDSCFERVAPEVIFHLAAQPLVRESYNSPRATFATNVLGTVHVLTAAVDTPSIRSVVSVTTDKVYVNDGRHEGYCESDPLGGRDPYSASKACADIAGGAIAQSFSRPGLAIATARSGNVIGGGDTAKDRLVPDLILAFRSGVPAKIRNPSATRPWLHVLDPLAGYLELAMHLENGGSAGAWNFGPVEAPIPVGELADLVARQWPGSTDWHIDAGPHPHEEAVLALDPTRAINDLGWKPRLNASASVAWTLEFETRGAASFAGLMSDQISRYLTLP